ncbi:MAG: adenosylcobalamin-dependent ribonucleoside-diphosphate reductase [Proteobacteria bacterium]|nr:adenosylcobalamin-dependent ribonucleoside-diphosphate reductase [Pseudomonadota bacterium]
MPFDAAISGEIWNAKYRFQDGCGGDASIEQTWARIADAAASAEGARLRSYWRDRFMDALSDFKFLPAGRIIAGAGTGRAVTLFNCFVMGTIPDSLNGIFEHLREAALTMQQGGGVGMDFSTIRPAGAPVRGVGAQASGPLSFMDAWDAMCRTVMSAGQRRGAMMACLRIDHPDIETFIDAKRDPARLRNFNVSALVSDAFMAALAADQDWPLQFDGVVYRSVKARELWAKLMRATYDVAEPGVIFVDRVNSANNLAYCETLSATNPCGEQPLPPYGACLLGSINLSRLVDRAFETKAALNEDRLADLTRTAVRFLDNIIDISRYPLPEQEAEAKAKRRIGLGVTGLADALIFCGARYGADDGIALTRSWLRIIRDTAYRASAELAAEKGPFPLYDRAMLERPMLASLGLDVRALIEANGLRNGCLTTIAPTGTISLLAGNTSSGIEPVFAFNYRRKRRQPDNSYAEETVEDYAYAHWRRHMGEAPLPEHSFVSAQTLTPRAHLEMQAAAQEFIDSSISKTINCPENFAFEEFADVYRRAYDLGCKGCTTYRPNVVTGSILSVSPSTPTPAEAIAKEPILAVRPPTLLGKTYKIKWPESEHALYVTINDIEEDGRRRPFEIFINSKNMEHYAWTLALTRMISAVFRRGGDVAFVAEELKAVFDPRGGAWLGGRYVPSLLAAIGDVIQQHLDADAVAPAAADAPAVRVPKPRACPKCGAAALIRAEGCDKCLECGYSKCS